MSTLGQLEVNSCKFTWKLENFSKLGLNVEDQIESPIFKIANCNDCCWSLLLYPYGKDIDSQGFVSLYVFNESEIAVNNCFELILSDKNGLLIGSRKDGCEILPKKGAGFSKFCTRDSILKKQEGLLDDILNIICIVHIDLYSPEEVGIDKKILTNYKSLFFNENFSDVTITIKKNKLKVHKNILSARSKVFQAMFRHNMKENNTNTIKITDVSYNIMKELLLFIYSGRLENLEKNAKNLLAAANKYEIKELKVLCEKSIWKNVKIEDACETLLTADLYNCSVLKTKIIEFITANIKEITKTPGYKNLNRSNPELFEELITEVLQKKC